MLLSRVAEAVYWAGRYLERAEDMARVVQVHGETHVDLPVGADVGWGPLLDICGADKAVDRTSPATGVGTDAPPRPRGRRVSESTVVGFVVTDRDNPSSILSALEAARDNLRVARPVVPREVWELINDLWLALSTDAHQMRTRDGRVRWLRRAIDECTRMNGVLASTMRRDEAMAFLSIGQQIERADITGRILTVRADSAAPGDGPRPLRRGALDGPSALGGRLSAVSPGHAGAPRQWCHLALPPPGRLFSPSRVVLPERASGHGEEASGKRRGAGRLRRCVGPGGRRACRSAHTGRTTIASSDDLQGALVRHPRSTRCDLLPVHDHHDLRTFPRPAPALPAHRERRASRPSTGTGGPQERVYRVSHRTTYEYDGPVEQSYNEAHLRPRTTGHQKCTWHTLDIEPVPTSQSEYVDAFGNAVSIFVVAGGFERLSVTATSEVTVHRVPPPPPSPPWESALWLLDIDRQAHARQARQYRAPSRLVPASPDLAQYAQPSFEAGRPLVDAVVDLAGRIHRDFVYEPGFTSVTTPRSRRARIPPGRLSGLRPPRCRMCAIHGPGRPLREWVHRDGGAGGTAASGGRRRLSRLVLGLPARVGMDRHRSHQRSARLGRLTSPRPGVVTTGTSRPSGARSRVGGCRTRSTWPSTSRG